MLDGSRPEEGELASLGPRYQALIRTAAEARASAYCPYSKFRVGAALLCGNDIVFSGGNVENASYGLTVCAERVAIFKAVSEGYRNFTALAVAADVKEFYTTPCGACRQVLAEFGQDWIVFVVKPDLSWMKVKVSELLPLAFIPKALDRERVPAPEKSKQT